MNTDRHRSDRSFSVLAALVLAAAIGLGACGRGAPSSGTNERAGTPVSGRVDTGSGVTIEFGDGWTEVPAKGRPFSKYYVNREAQIDVGLGGYNHNGRSAAAIGEELRQRFSADGVVIASDPLTVDGHDAWKTVVDKKTVTGRGLVEALTIIRDDRHATTVYAFSSGDVRPGHREAIDALLATVRLAP